MIGAISQATKQIPLSTGVTCPIMRIHPAIIAQAAATAAAMMPGRFSLGIGSGENLNEHILGDHWPPTPTRLEMMKEAVEIIRELWTGKEITHYGKYFTVENTRIYTLPESFRGTADGQTGVDKYTQENLETGTMPNRRMGILYQEGLDSGNIPKSQIQGSDNQMHGAVSVWDRAAFSIGISENSNPTVASTEIFRSAYRSADWIAQRSLE